MLKTYDIDYYVAFGIKSYGALAFIYHAGYWDKTQKELFIELTQEFRTMVDIFADVREQTDIESQGGLLRLYERWVKTRSQRNEPLLKAQGIMPNQDINLAIFH